MLVLSRKVGEKIFIGDDICVTITDIDRGTIRIGIQAPRDVEILRGELKERQRAANEVYRQSAEAHSADAEVYKRDAEQQAWVDSHDKQSE